MASFITPFRPIETGPPWGWNPGQTFVQAFNDAQAIQIKREEMENERQIMEILMPYKFKKAALDLEELKSDMKFNEASVDLRRQEIQYKNRVLEETLNSRNQPRAFLNSSGFFETADDASQGMGGVDADQPLPPVSDEGEASIFDSIEDNDLTKNADQTGLSYRVSDQTRDELGQKSTAQNRQVSLDFNSGSANSRGVEIVIPSDATPEERAAAEDYTNKLTAWYKNKGIDVPNRGVLTKTGSGKSVSRFHTEPFFVQDAEARAAVESDPDGYADVLASTLGRLPVTFIPPHKSNDPGASDGDFNERDFARSTIIPALRRLQEGGRTETRTASTTATRTGNPLIDEEDGFNNPLAQLNEEAVVPIGEQYTGGETSMASGKFETSLKNAAPSSGVDVSQVGQTSQETEAQVPAEEKIIEEIRQNRSKFSANVDDMRRRGVQVNPEEIREGVRLQDKKAFAALFPFIDSKFGPAGIESFRQLTSGETAMAPEEAYQFVERSVRAAKNEPVDPKVLDEQLNQSAYRIKQMRDSGVDERDPLMVKENEIYSGLQEKRLGRQKSTALNKFYETGIEMQNLNEAFKAGVIDENDFNTQSQTLKQQSFQLKKDALLEEPERLVDLSNYEYDDKKRLTPESREAIAARLEPYKGSVIGLTGRKKGQTSLATRVVTQEFIDSIRRGRTQPVDDTETEDAPSAKASGTRILPKIPTSARATAKTAQDVGRGFLVGTNPVEMYNRYVGRPFAENAGPWLQEFAAGLTDDDEEEK